jgi:Uma2 family endonuclease
VSMGLLQRPEAEAWTVDDLEGLPDDGNRYELIDGQLHVTPPPVFVHQRVATRLARELGDACPDHLEVFASPIGWRISRSTALEPDVTVVPREWADRRLKRAEEPPLLVVEVLSPSTRRYDMGTKLLAYQDAGLTAYWIIDPHEPSVAEYRLDGGELVLLKRLRGSTMFATDVPFPVEFSPSSLVD